MKTQGLTATIIFEAQSLNYDERYGNLSIIKKFHRGNGDVYTYTSRQSLRYSIFLQGYKEYGWTPSEVDESGSGDKKVVQLISDIAQSEESDLFGYMRTNVKIGNNEVSIMRTAPVRLTPAISLEPFRNDMEMLTNKYQSDKIQAQPNISNSEVHRSLYKYTISIDLHRIGTEEDEVGTRISPNKEETKKSEEFKKFVSDFRKRSLDKTIKIKRVKELLDIIGTLYRDIRGRREDLKPLFIIGGIYDICNPFFANIIKIDNNNNLPRIVVEPIKQILEPINQNTYIGIREGIFMNDNEIKNIFMNDNKNTKTNSENNGLSKVSICSPEDAICKLKNDVEAYYNNNMMRSE